jgi:hypothetical protein
MHETANHTIGQQVSLQDLAKQRDAEFTSTSRLWAAKN